MNIMIDSKQEDSAEEETLEKLIWQAGKDLKRMKEKDPQDPDQGFIKLQGPDKIIELISKIKPFFATSEDFLKDFLINTTPDISQKLISSHTNILTLLDVLEVQTGIMNYNEQYKIYESLLEALSHLVYCFQLLRIVNKYSHVDENLNRKQEIPLDENDTRLREILQRLQLALVKLNRLVDDSHILCGKIMKSISERLKSDQQYKQIEENVQQVIKKNTLVRADEQEYIPNLNYLACKVLFKEKFKKYKIPDETQKLIFNILKEAQSADYIVLNDFIYEEPSAA